MEIIDRRKEKYLNIAVIEILKKLIKAAPSKYFIGVKRIIVLDTDFEKEQKNAIGRWQEIGGARRAEILLMMDAFEAYPKEFVEFELTIAFEFSRILFHEVYHNLQKRLNKRQHKKKQEEEKADEFAFQETITTLRNIYPHDKILEWREQYYKITGLGKN